MTTANDIYKTLADLNITLPPISVPAAAYVPYGLGRPAGQKHQP